MVPPPSGRTASRGVLSMLRRGSSRVPSAGAWIAGSESGSLYLCNRGLPDCAPRAVAREPRISAMDDGGVRRARIVQRCVAQIWALSAAASGPARISRRAVQKRKSAFTSSTGHAELGAFSDQIDVLVGPHNPYIESGTAGSPARSWGYSCRTSWNTGTQSGWSLVQAGLAQMTNSGRHPHRPASIRGCDAFARSPTPHIVSVREAVYVVSMMGLELRWRCAPKQ
jgi:hypothetical protein